mmetsp:Transcript_8577/g.24638  ORF Transcript_8577/g.24638 Transcript_8577/m.24638 type:complete len:246 (+) Transcript_8577:545-1282(+)
MVGHQRALGLPPTSCHLLLRAARYFRQPRQHSLPTADAPPGPCCYCQWQKRPQRHPRLVPATTRPLQPPQIPLRPRRQTQPVQLQRGRDAFPVPLPPQARLSRRQQQKCSVEWEPPRCSPPAVQLGSAQLQGGQLCPHLPPRSVWHRPRKAETSRSQPLTGLQAAVLGKSWPRPQVAKLGPAQRSSCLPGVTQSLPLPMVVRLAVHSAAEQGRERHPRETQALENGLPGWLLPLASEHQEIQRWY